MSIKEKFEDNKGKLILAGLAGVLGLVTIGPVYSYHGNETVRITVTNKEVKRYDDVDKYKIDGRLENGELEVFENTDIGLPFHWKYNSSDLQAEMQIGGTYDVEVYGWRTNYWSWFRNIVSVTEVEAPANNSKRPVSQNVLGGSADETFVEIDGQKYYSKIDGQTIDEYVRVR